MPIKMSVPAQPTAPTIRQNIPKTENPVPDFNFRAGDGDRTGFPQISLNGAVNGDGGGDGGGGDTVTESWISLTTLPGSKTPLTFILEVLNEAKVDLTWPGDAQSRSIYIRIGASTTKGVSAVQRLEIQKAHWVASLPKPPEPPEPPVDP